MTRPAHIVVLGAGPAGATAALGLQRLGYRVTVLSDWRRFDAVEGVSARVVQALRGAGLAQAAGCAGPARPRTTCWNGTRRVLNVEHLLERRVFDAALRRDLAAAGVAVREATVLGVRADGARHEVRARTPAGIEVVHADFLVEARGSGAPRSREALRGPRTLTVMNTWRAAPDRGCGGVESHPDGWAWMARLDDGRCFWQVSLDVDDAGVPARAGLAAYCARLRQSELARDCFPEPAQDVRLHARGSTPRLCDELAGPNWLRVGDAAMSVDPLSGNGIFQSMSSALQAPAVVRTLLERPASAALAQRFHAARVRHLFERFARIGRDFHLLEQRWAEQPFWRVRAAWPDAEPSHPRGAAASLRVARGPVIDGDWIVEADVVFAPDLPLGVWHVDGVPLAPIVAALHDGALEPALRALAPQQAARLRRWLAAYDAPVSI